MVSSGPKDLLLSSARLLLSALGVEFLHLKEHKHIQSILFKHYHHHHHHHHHHQIMVKSSPILEIRCWAETKSPETPHLLSAGHQPGPPGEGSKNIPLEPLVFYGLCNSFETKPNISVACAALWKWNRALDLLEITHFVNRLEIDAAVSTIFATLWSSNLSFSMVGLKLI